MTKQNWLPIIDTNLCTGCGDCVVACPTKALDLVEKTAVVIAPNACDYCAICEAICPTGAITLPYQLVLESVE